MPFSRSLFSTSKTSKLNKSADAIDVEESDVPDGYLYACAFNEVPERKGKKVKLSGKSVALFRRDEERIFALRNACSHQGVPLANGDIEEINGKLCVSCPGHDFKFELKTGQCLTNSKYVQRRYAAVVLDGKVYVKLS